MSSDTLNQTLETQLAQSTDPGQRIELLNALAANLRHSDLERAWAINREVEQLAQSADFAAPNYQGLADCFYWRGKLYSLQSDYEQALICFYRALAYAEQAAAQGCVDPPPSVARYVDAADQFLEHGATISAIHNVLGITLVLLEQFDEALRHYMQAWQLVERNQDHWIKVLLCNNIGYLYREIDNPAQAASYLEQGLKLLGEFPTTTALQRLQATLLDNFCWCAAQTAQPASAIEYGKESLQLFQTIGWQQGEAEVLNCLGMVYQQIGDYAQAQDYFARAAQVATAIHSNVELVCALIKSSELLRLHGDPASAIAQLLQALTLTTSQKQLFECHLLLAELYEDAEQYAAALQHYKQYQTLKEQVFNEKSDQRLKVLQVVHQLKQARKEAEMYQLRSATLELEIQERTRAQAELERLATTDSLTGLYNRRHFFGLAQREYVQAQRYQRPLAAILLDVDHFKDVNDRHGHGIGDQVLCAVAALILETIRQADIVGRYGGEEFALILPETDLAGALIIAERLRTRIAQHTVFAHHTPITVTVSLGVAQIDLADPDPLETLIQQTDHALYQAKRAGRNKTRGFKL